MEIVKYTIHCKYQKFTDRKYLDNGVSPNSRDAKGNTGFIIKYMMVYVYNVKGIIIAAGRGKTEVCAIC